VCDGGGGGGNVTHVDQDSVGGVAVGDAAGFHLKEKTITMEHEVEEASYAIKSFFLGMRFQLALLSALDTCSGGAIFSLCFYNLLLPFSCECFSHCFFLFFGFYVIGINFLPSNLDILTEALSLIIP
jgi:hypothetical protein